MYIGRKIYYEVSTGNVLVDTGERRGMVVPTTIEDDIRNFNALTERNQETFDVIELVFGQNSRDFAECNGYRVNPESKELEFSYPDPNEPEIEQPYQKPLSESIKELKDKLVVQDLTMEDLMFNILPNIGGGL